MERSSKYSNKVVIGASINEITIEAIKTEPIYDEKYTVTGEDVVESTFIHTSPQHAKKILIALTNVISDYEKKYGTINTDEPKPTVQ